jgi:phosphoglycerate dehydrogenase-like enzyme
MTNRILVTPRSLTAEPHPHVEKLRERGFDIVYSTPGTLPGEEELIRLVPDCVGWLAGVEPISERVIDAATALKVISRNGIGVDNLPLAKLSDRGVKVAVAGGANARGVAELTIGLMFAALRAILLPMPASSRAVGRAGAASKSRIAPSALSAAVRLGAKWLAWRSALARAFWPMTRRGPISTCLPALRATSPFLNCWRVPMW